MVLLQAYMRFERVCGRYRTCSDVDVRGGAEQDTGARYWAVVNASGADDCSEPTYHLHAMAMSRPCRIRAQREEEFVGFTMYAFLHHTKS
jgi:hypothetical protein